MRRSSPHRPSGSIRVVTGLARAAPAALPAMAGPASPSREPRLADVRLCTGVRLSYAAQGDADGLPVILLHGLSDSWFSFSRVLPEISKTYRLYALDLRGHCDIERAALVGHSMGSFVVQQVALAAPERVAGVGLIGSAAEARNEVMQELQAALASLPDTVPAEFAKEFQAGTVHLPVPEDFMRRVVSESVKAPARVWRAALAGLVESGRFGGLPGSGVPALLIWGDRDGIFPRSEQEALVAALPVARLRVYRDTGHAPHWERPGEVVRDLASFLRTALW